MENNIFSEKSLQTKSLIKLETTKYFRQAKQHLPQAISAI